MCSRESVVSAKAFVSLFRSKNFYSQDLALVLSGRLQNIYEGYLVCKRCSQKRGEEKGLKANWIFPFFKRDYFLSERKKQSVLRE